MPRLAKYEVSRVCGFLGIAGSTGYTVHLFGCSDPYICLGEHPFAYSPMGLVGQPIDSVGNC